MTAQSTIAQQCKDKAWNTQPANGILAHYAAIAEGFSTHTQEKQQRLTTDGPDERELCNHVSPFHSFLGQFDILIIWILIVAGVLLALLGGSVEVIVVVLFNAIIFFFQDFNFSMEKSQHSTLEDDRPTQHTATRNPLKGPGSELRLIGQQPAD